MRVIYLNPAAGGAANDLLRTGEAGCVAVTADGALEMDSRVLLSANSTHALLGHGVVDRLNELPLEGKLGDGREVLVPPSHLDTARALFFEADRKTYGARYEFVVGQGTGPEPVEYRLRIDNREYQSTLSHLTFLMSVASREGLAVWMRI